MPIRRKPVPTDANILLQTTPVQHETSRSAFQSVLGDKLVQSSAPLPYQTQERHLESDTSNLTVTGPEKSEEEGHFTADSDHQTQSHVPEDPTITYPSSSFGLVESPSAVSAAGSWLEEQSTDSPPMTSSTFPPDSTTHASASLEASNVSGKTDKRSKVASALQDASHFLGGLIKHPVESTKHYTILRHSHGLVYYKGPATSIAITVFADRPLPSNRRYWFQMKGWTGNTGMRAKALLRTNWSWINVTPDRRALAEELPSSDERAWQRDIKKFRDKAPKTLGNHVVRETAIIRVPSEATDGYFRVVLTGADSRSTLCPSPVFRVASTSMSASSIKGASLATLPLELSINILQFAATTVASTAVAPFAETARSQVAGMLPSTVANYGQTAYDISGAQDEVENLNQQYNDKRTELVEQAQESGTQYIPMSRSDVVGDDSGPDIPFPMKLNSTIAPGTGGGLREVGVPTANLSSVPADVVATLNGIYFGWAYITPKDKALIELHSGWRHAIISINCESAKASVAAKKSVKAYLLHNFGGQEFYDSKISLVIMGYLRPVIPHENKEAFFTETMRDIEITRLSLERDEWAPDITLERIKTNKSERSISDRYIDTRMAVQRRVDTLPIHRLGVRTESFGLQDRGMYGNGGLYVIRDRV